LDGLPQLAEVNLVQNDLNDKKEFVPFVTAWVGRQKLTAKGLKLNTNKFSAKGGHSHHCHIHIIIVTY
jgi:hypothetical protein